MFYTYMIRCKDNSIYTGMTNNIDERFNKHSTGTGAKIYQITYTRKNRSCMEKQRQITCL